MHRGQTFIMHSQSKRTASTPRELIALRPPKTPYAYFIWRFKLWMGTTFSTCVMETWEVYVICEFIFGLLSQNCRSSRPCHPTSPADSPSFFLHDTLFPRPGWIVPIRLRTSNRFDQTWPPSFYQSHWHLTHPVQTHPPYFSGSALCACRRVVFFLLQAIAPMLLNY